MKKTASKQFDPCADLDKALGAATGALGIAVEHAQRLPKIIDEDELTGKDASTYAAVNEAENWLEQAEEALRKCRDGL